MPSTDSPEVAVTAAVANGSARAPVVEVLKPGDEAAWDAYVASKQDATLYHLRAWKTVTEAAYGYEAPFLMARDGPGGAVRAVLPLFRVARPFAPYLTSGPFGAYGPILADDPAAGRAVVDAARAMVDQGRAKHLHLKLLGEPPPWLDVPLKSVSVIGLLELGADPDAQFKKIGTAMRTKVRYAQRGGLQKATGADQLEGFYDVLGENMRRRGSPMYGRPFMQRLLEALGPNATVLTLSHEGQVVSGTFLAWFNGVLYMPFASSRPSVFKLRANYLLYWEVICLGIEKRLRALDFGTSPKSSPGLEFKGAWRPVFQPVTSALYARDGKVPAIEVADSPFAQTAIKLWSKLPRSFVEAIGPSICKWVA